MRRFALLALAGAIFLLPSVPRAANENKPRVLVAWTSAPCIQVVDLPAASTQHFDYSIGNEDPGPRGADEVSDSRTHQFLAFSRHPGEPESDIPNWLTWADIERAALVDPQVIPSAINDEEVLETSTAFSASDWLRITADDERFPITFDQAEQGFEWSVSGVAPGAYVIAGYTFDPHLNKWSLRPGVVKLKGEGVEGDLPAAAFDSVPELGGDGSQPIAITGCADLLGMGKLTASYGVTDGAETTWATFVESEPLETGTFALEFQVPQEYSDKAIWFRVDIEDAEGRTYQTYAPRRTLFVNDDDESGSDESGSGESGSGESGGGESGSDESGGDEDAESGSTSDSGAQDDDDTGSSGCRIDDGFTPITTSMSLLLFAFGGWSITRRKAR